MYKIIDNLRQHIAAQNYIDIHCSIGDGQTEISHGIPLAMSTGLIMLIDFIDFIPNGYAVIRINDINAIEYSDSCRFFEKVVKQEGARDLLNRPIDFPVENLESVFSVLQKRNLVAIVDVGKYGCVNVGRVEKVTNVSVAMRCISPTGLYDDDVWVEQYINISKVSFCNSYTHMFAKYSQNA